MLQMTVKNQDMFTPRELPLSSELHAYVAVLSRKAAGEINFRTGAGRLQRDLLLHWPLVEDWEPEAQEICKRITDAVYPLVGELYAQAVEINVTIAPRPILPPEKIDALSTCVLFDTEKQIERILFLSPEQAMPEAALMSVPKGIIVLCRPLHYRYHTISDDRKHVAHVQAGMFELPQRLINELYEMPDFIPQEKAIIAAVMKKIDELPKAIAQAEQAAAAATMQKQAVTAESTRPLPVIPVMTSLSALPGSILVLERILLSYIMDPNLSPELRYRFRYISQLMRALYPRALIEEAARNETARPLLKVAPAPAAAPAKAQAMSVIPAGFPKSVPVAAVGKLGAVVNKKTAEAGDTPVRRALPEGGRMPMSMFNGEK